MSSHRNNEELSRLKFYKLGNELDDVLNHFSKDIYIISNPYLHLSRNHPEYLDIWKSLIYQEKIKIRDDCKILFRLTKEFVSLVKAILTNCVIPVDKKQSRIESIQNPEYLFISHYLGNELSDIDSYYGNIISFLAKRGIKVSRALIPHSTVKREVDFSSTYHSLILNSQMTRNKLATYIVNNLKATISLIFYCGKNKFSFYQTVALLVGQLSNLQNFQILINIDTLLVRDQPKKVVMTFEGNGIERCIFYVCNIYGITSIGYQHAPIIKDQYSIFRTLNDDLEPSIIWTTGPYIKKKFIQKIGQSKPVYTLGSPKYVAGDKNPGNSISPRNILLIPDGNKASIDMFFNLGLAIGEQYEKSKIIIRCHPLFESYAKDKFENYKAKFNSIPFTFSLLPLDKDLKLAEWLVYQNSSVSIQALYSDCKLIYLTHNLANIDPLFESINLRFEAKTFDDVLSLILNSKIDKYDIVGNRVKFASDYFSSLSEEILINFFKI